MVRSNPPLPLPLEPPEPPMLALAGAGEPETPLPISIYITTVTHSTGQRAYQSRDQSPVAHSNRQTCIFAAIPMFDVTSHVPCGNFSVMRLYSFGRQGDWNMCVICCVCVCVSFAVFHLLCVCVICCVCVCVICCVCVCHLYCSTSNPR